MGIPLIGGLLDGGSNGNKAREEEERRKAEEAAREAEEAAEERRAAEAEAAEERQAQMDEAAESRRESSLGSFERRQVREDDRGAPIQRRALESIATQRDEPQTPVTPQFQMSIPEDEIRFQANVDIPDDEIRFTPNAPAEQPDPYQRVLDASAPYQQGAAGGRAVNFDALDAQQDAADVASASQARANLGGGGAPPPVTPQPQSGTVAPQQTTPMGSPASGPAQPPGAQESPSSPLAPPAPPAAAPLPDQQRAADARQQTVQPQGSRLPPDIRTAAMPQSSAGTQQALDTSSEDEARTALRRERILKALGYITKIGLGAGALALDARGGSPAAAQFMAGAGGMVGNAMINSSPTQQQARITQARGVDEQRARGAEDLDLRRITQAAQERRAQMLEAQQAQRLDLESRRVGAMEEGIGLRAEQVGAQAEAARALAAQRTAQGDIARTEAEAAQMARDPESPVSRQAQQELRALMERVPEDERISDEEIGALSADAATTLYNQVARRYGLRTRQTQRRSGEGGGPRAEGLGPTRSFRDFAQREYPQLQGMSEAEREAAVTQAWSQLSSAERRAYVGGSAMSDTREDDERVARANNLPGWRWRNGDVPPDAVTLRAGQDASEGAASATANLGDMLRIAGQIGAGDRALTAIGESEIGAQYQAARNAFIGSLPALRNTGVINEGEYERFRREFPDVTDLRSAGAIRNQIQAAQQVIGRGYRLKMQALGWEPDSGGGGERRGGGGGQTFRVRTPRGIAVRPDTPEERARAERAGFEVLR